MDNSIFINLPELLLPWYRANKRDLPWRQSKDPYRVWISEIMLQQTRVEAVRGYYARFLEALPDIRALAEADAEVLNKLWEGLGYYSRVRSLQKAARQIMTEHGGVFPHTYKEIAALAGIGPYTAGALSSICFELPRAAVDGNVLRILARMTGDDSPIDLKKTKERAAQNLEAVYPEGHCGDFTQALMELGATVCIPKNPRCLDCPASSVCVAHKEGRTAELPVKSPKKEKRVEERTVFLLECSDKIALEKRPPKGLLAGLWQLPNQLGKLDVNAAMAEAARMGALPERPLQQISRVHIFTHIRWEMTCYHIACRGMPDAFTWVTREALEERYALPTAFKQFFTEE